MGHKKASPQADTVRLIVLAHSSTVGVQYR